MDATDKAIDGEPSRLERVLIIGMRGVLAVLIVSALLIFVGYALGFFTNPWLWVTALMLAFFAYVLVKLLLGGKLVDMRTRTEVNPEEWSPS